VYYLETAVSVAQPFLHGENTPHYVSWEFLCLNFEANKWIKLGM
jgi:hypothetical protein